MSFRVKKCSLILISLVIKLIIDKIFIWKRVFLWKFYVLITLLSNFLVPFKWTRIWRLLKSLAVKLLIDDIFIVNWTSELLPLSLYDKCACIVFFRCRTLTKCYDLGHIISYSMHSLQSAFCFLEVRSETLYCNIVLKPSP